MMEGNDLGGLATLEPGPMGKKKAQRPKQKTLFAIKGDEAFLEWVRGLSEHVGLPMTNTIDQALKLYAEASGFDEPMPSRRVR